MAHQYLAKIFHDPSKNSLAPSPTYLMYGPLLDHASVLTPRYFTEFDGYNLFPVSLIWISSENTFPGDLEITSSVFSALSEILFALNQSFNFFTSRLTSSFRFFSVELPFEDH